MDIEAGKTAEEPVTSNPDHAAEAAEFIHLSLAAHGHSQGWKFNRDEIHER